jgi:DNA repair protein RecO (recombination protein O)
MGKGSRRVELAPLYVLHHRPWRDTSRMLDVFTRDHGRLMLFARGVRGPKSRAASALQPFRLLLGSWSTSGEAGQLSQVEVAASRDSAGDLEARPAATGVADEGGAAAGEPQPLPAAALLSGWYLNELVLKLTVRNDPQPQVFDLYHDTLRRLRTQSSVAAALRRFERQLLELLGYGVEFRHDARAGEALQPGASYHFHPELGFIEVSGEAAAAAAAFRGRDLLAVADDDYDDPAVLETARRVLRTALDRALEGRELNTRAVARSVARRQRDRETS